MKRGPKLFALGVPVGIVLLTGYFAVRLMEPTPFNSEIEDYYNQPTISNQDAEMMAPEFIRAFPKITPLLRKILLGDDSRRDRFLRHFQARMPNAIQQLLPQRPNKDKLRVATIFVLPELGPYARPLIPTIIERLPAVANPIEARYLLNSLVWFVDESPAAAEAFRKYIRAPSPQRFLFDVFDQASRPNPHRVWAHFPDLANAITPWLQYTNSFYDAITAIHHLGPNAAAAADELIRIWENPTPHNSPAIHPRTHGTTKDKLSTQRRVLEAMGAIQSSDPRILEILSQAWKADSASLRASAARAIRDLGPAAAPLVHDLLPHIDYTNETVLSLQFQALGALDVSDPALLNLLRPWGTISQEEIIWEDPTSPGNPRIESIRLSPHHAAAVALWSLNAEDRLVLVHTISDILQLNFVWDTTESWRFLEKFRSGKDLLTSSINRSLDQLTGEKQTLLAGRFFYIAPDNERCKQILVEAMKESNPEHSVQTAKAARDYFLGSKDPTFPLRAFRNVFRQELASTHQIAALRSLESLGKKAESLAPLLAPYLAHDSRETRVQAWLTLEQIAPQRYAALGFPPSLADF